MSTSGGGIQADDTEAVASADAIPAGPTTGTGYWTATGLASSLQAWSDGATNHGWVIFTGDNSVCLRSKADNDIPDRPLLTVDYSPGLSAPTIAKAFAPITIPAGGTSTITFTLTNPNAALLTVANFTDTYPAGMVNTTGLVVGGTCASVTYTAAAGGSSFDLDTANIPASGSCTVTVDVTATATGVNTTSVLGTNEAPNSAAGGSDTLTVNSLPSITKSFAPSTITSGGTSTITFTLTNPTAGLLTGANFTDTYPATMVNTTGLVVGGTCANVTHTAVAGGSTFNLTAGDIPASGSCTVTVDVTATATGVNTTSALGTNEAPNSAAGGSDTLTVSAAADVTQIHYRWRNDDGGRAAARRSVSSVPGPRRSRMHPSAIRRLPAPTASTCSSSPMKLEAPISRPLRAVPATWCARRSASAETGPSRYFTKLSVVPVAPRTALLRQAAPP